MWTFPILAYLAALNSGSAFAEAPASRVPVDLRLVGDDGLTQKFHVALEEGLEKHPSLRLAKNRTEARVIVESDSNVDHDKLAGREVVIYLVYVYRGPDRGDPITGVCFASRMSKCAKDILRIVSLEADPL